MSTCLENRVAVYSPHTAYDVVEKGVADWLISAFGKERCYILVHRASVEDRVPDRLRTDMLMMFQRERFLC